MAYSVSYKASVAGDLRRLDRPAARRVLRKLEHALSADSAAGTPLTGEFQGLFRLRVGDYRIVYAKIPGGVLVLRIRNRKDVYR